MFANWRQKKEEEKLDRKKNEEIEGKKAAAV